MKKKAFFLGVLPMCMIGAFFTGMFTLPEEKKTSELVFENIEAFTTPTELPEVVVTCGANEGKCWLAGGFLKYCGEYSYYECIFVGETSFYCTNLC